MQTAPSEELMIRIITVINTHQGSAFIAGLKRHLSDVPPKKIDEAITHMKEKKMVQVQKDSSSSLYLVKTIKKEQDKPELF